MRALHENGARILAGTDAEGTYVVHGISLHEELENLVAAGYSPYEALEVATSGPAEFLNRQQDSGTITAGKFANLVLLQLQSAFRYPAHKPAHWRDDPRPMVYATAARLLAGTEPKPLTLPLHSPDRSRIRVSYQIEQRIVIGHRAFNGCTA